MPRVAVSSALIATAKWYLNQQKSPHHFYLMVAVEKGENFADYAILADVAAGPKDYIMREIQHMAHTKVMHQALKMEEEGKTFFADLQRYLK